MADRSNRHNQRQTRSAWSTFWHALWHDDEAEEVHEDLRHAHARDRAEWWRTFGRHHPTFAPQAWEKKVLAKMKENEQGIDAMQYLYSPRRDQVGMIEKEAALRTIVTTGLYREFIGVLCGPVNQANNTLRANFGFRSAHDAQYFIRMTYGGAKGPWVLRGLIIRLLTNRVTPPDQKFHTADFLGQWAIRSGEYQWFNLVRRTPRGRREWTPLVNPRRHPLPPGELSQIEIVANRISSMAGGPGFARTISDDMIFWTDSTNRTRPTRHWIEVCRRYPEAMGTLLDYWRSLSSSKKAGLLAIKSQINRLAPSLVGRWP